MEILETSIQKQGATKVSAVSENVEFTRVYGRRLVRQPTGNSFACKINKKAAVQKMWLDCIVGKRLYMEQSKLKERFNDESVLLFIPKGVLCRWETLTKIIANG